MGWRANPTHLEAHSVAAAEVGEMTHANPGDYSYQQLACKLTSCRVEKGGENRLLQVPLSSSALPELVTLTSRASARM